MEMGFVLLEMYVFVLQVKRGKWKRESATCYSKRKHPSEFLPASGGLYSKSNQESICDFHLLCQSFQYSLNQPVKDKEKIFEEGRQNVYLERKQYEEVIELAIFRA